eukprot:GFUD01028623.1.p1 GENE.GFUD01028623.1~~GFUD01028623.1.p1  ORF type:complete len:1467 (+),score=533.39 GFUD01028623.1:218-4618(+)
MEKVRNEKNDAVISALDSLKSYATKYEEKKTDKKDEEKKKEEIIVQQNLKMVTKMTIQEQIAETLRLAKEKATEKSRVEKEAKADREENEKIVSAMLEFIEWEVMEILDREVKKIDFYEEEIQMDILAKETQVIIEREEKKRKEKEQLIEILRERERENQRLAEEAKMKLEQEMKAKIMKELDNIKQLQEQQCLKIKEEENKKENEREAAKQKEAEDMRITHLKDEDERKRKEYSKIQRVSEEAKKMTLSAALKSKSNEEQIKQIKQASENIEKEEEINTDELIDKKKDREDEVRFNLEEGRKLALAIIEKRRLEEEEFCKIKKEAEQRRAEELKLQKLKDHQRKIDHLSLSKQQDSLENTKKLERPKKNPLSNPLAMKFEELAQTAINEKQVQKYLQMKKQKCRLKKQSLLNRSKQILNKVTKTLGRSQNLQEKSKEHIDQNDAYNNVEVSAEEERKRVMQNYLISQVLFDGEEEVNSMPIVQEIDIDESDNTIAIEDKAGDFELKKQQAFFEAYKKNMEEYLNFVCEGKKIKETVNKEKAKTTQINKNLLDVNIIKKQFEEWNEYKPENFDLNPEVKKLSSSKLSFANKNPEDGDQTKKTYIPVIIDKEAFDRTVSLFEKEKLEEENRKILSEMKLKKEELINKVKCELSDIGMEQFAESKQNNTDYKNSVESERNNERKIAMTENEEVTPKWIQVFLDRSKQTAPEKQQEKEKTECDRESHDRKLNSMLEIIEGSATNNKGKKQETLSLATENIEQFCKVKDGLEESNSENKQKLKEQKVIEYPGFQDKMSKFKSLFSNKTETSTRKDCDRTNSTKDTERLRNKFKTNSLEDDKNEEVYRPKKKLINVTGIVDETNVPSKKEKQIWKWKQQTNTPPREHPKEDIESNLPKEKEEISSIEKEIEQVMFIEELIKDNEFDRTQVYMENIKAYLDLIEDKKDIEEEVSKKENPVLSGSSYFSKALNLDTIIDKLSGNKAEIKTNETKDIGKVKHNFNNKEKQTVEMIEKQDCKAVSLKVSNMKKNVFERQENTEQDTLGVEKVIRKIIDDPFSIMNKKSHEKVFDKRPNFKKFDASKIQKLSLSSSLQNISSNKVVLKEPPSVTLSETNQKSERTKFVPKTRTYSDSDIDDILNYENSDEIANYEQELREQYNLDDSSSPQESIHELENKKTNSFANLLDILTLMRKTNLSKSVSNSKTSLLENMSQKKVSSSEIDLSVNGINKKFRNLYENGPESLRVEDIKVEEKTTKKGNMSEKQKQWENVFNQQKDEHKNTSSMCVDVGRTCSRQNNEEKSILRRTNSCRDISWERVSSELDEETLVNLSISKQVAKDMFESSTPKYRFGGSLANVKTENCNKQTTKKTNSAQKDFDGRKWVLDSINKHFDVILEEGEDESDSAYDDSDGQEDWTECEDEEIGDDQAPYAETKSSAQMQGLLKSVVSKITKSYSNLNDKDVMSSLKSKLEKR